MFGDRIIIRDIIEAARPLSDSVSHVDEIVSSTDYDELMDLIGEAHFVLLGEATHGTHEFYRQRAEITKRLIEEKGFHAVAVEADWPDAYRINRFVRGGGDVTSELEAFSDFKRFPSWMWRNVEVLEFVGWLREYNDQFPDYSDKIGFYGLDLYSLFNSMGAVINYLEKMDPEAAERARNRYSCFDHYSDDPQVYGYASSLGVGKPCEDDVINELIELRSHSAEYVRRDGRIAEDDWFFIEQNARIVMNAEAYYRSMFMGRVNTWNLRDRHMAETLENLIGYLSRYVDSPKIAVWAHNSHIGDARYTQMGHLGEFNIGQLMRERFPEETILIGFSTYTGTVTAASDWGGVTERKHVQPALPDSYEALFHETGLGNFWIPFRNQRDMQALLGEPYLERAIGVIYLPETERQSHYFHARLAKQFDAILHFDRTRAVEPLDRTSEWDFFEMPETYPSAL